MGSSSPSGPGVNSRAGTQTGGSAERPLALGITGASGAPYWRRLVELLLSAGRTVHLTHSSNADAVAQAELGLSLGDALAQAAELAGGRGRCVVFPSHDFYAPMASGTAAYAGMAIVPCSMGTLGRIAGGMSSDLLSRAADVMLKERRRLVLLCRETPLSLIHLENMVRVTRAGGVVLPASPGFYYRPQSVAELVDFMVQRICDQLAVPVRVIPAWGQPAPNSIETD